MATKAVTKLIYSCGCEYKSVSDPVLDAAAEKYYDHACAKCHVHNTKGKCC